MCVYFFSVNSLRVINFQRVKTNESDNFIRVLNLYKDIARFFFFL